MRLKPRREPDDNPNRRAAYFQEGDLTIVPIFEEIMVIEKQLLLKEELHIRKHRETDSVEVPVTLKRQWAHVARSDGES